MGKLIAILGACAVTAGGAGYAYHIYTDDHVCPSKCAVMPVACCGGPSDCNTTTADESLPGLAVAGPVALFAPASDNGIVAVAGVAATMK